MSLLIRPFRASDRSSLSTAIDVVCQECAWMTTMRFEPTPAWEHALSHPNCKSHRLLVVQAADRIAGWCRLFPLDNMIGLVQAELGIGLLKEYRYQSWGAVLLKEILKIVDETDCVQVTLSVHRDNTVARRLFSKHGFETIGFAPDGASLMMSRCVSKRISDQRARWSSAEVNNDK